MRVLINAAYMPLSSAEEYDSLVAAAFDVIISQQKNHHFIFVCTSQLAKERSENLQTSFHIVKSPGKSLLKYKYWLDIKVPRLLKKYKADVFVSPLFCSLTAKQPQIVWMPLLSGLYSESQSKKTRMLFYKKYIPAFINKAKQVVVFSVAASKELDQTYKLSPGKLLQATAVISPLFNTANEEIKATVKDKFTDGKEFFLTIGSSTFTTGIRQLLKAFSMFKKRQQSGMKLLIAIPGAAMEDSFKKNIASYKYRSDVVIAENTTVQVYAQLMSAAYTFVYAGVNFSIGLNAMQAMRAAIPVIAPATILAKEICGEAALYFENDEQQTIADLLMRIYKDEKLREALIAKSVLKAKELDPQQSAVKLMQYMETVLPPQS